MSALRTLSSSRPAWLRIPLLAAALLAAGGILLFASSAAGSSPPPPRFSRVRNRNPL